MADHDSNDLDDEYEQSLRQLREQRALTRTHRFAVAAKPGPAELVPKGSGGDGCFGLEQHVRLQYKPGHWTPPLLDVDSSMWTPYYCEGAFVTTGANENIVVYVASSDALYELLSILQDDSLLRPRTILIPREVSDGIDDIDDVYRRGLEVATRVVAVEQAGVPDPSRWLR